MNNYDKNSYLHQGYSLLLMSHEIMDKKDNKLIIDNIGNIGEKQDYSRPVSFL